MAPLVTVVVPTRNRLSQLRQALASVWNQTFQDFEVIVVVDGATDATLLWLESCGRELTILNSDVVIGAAAARNRGLERAQGRLIAFLDDDDIWRCDYLASQVKRLDLHPNAVLSYADHVNIDNLGSEIRPDTQPLMNYRNAMTWLLAESFIHTVSVVVFRKDVIDEVGSFDPKLRIVHDLDWYARILASGRTFTHLPSTLVERSVPGGLVTFHRQWFHEESTVLRRLLKNEMKEARLVRACRALFFARVGLSKGDISFGILCLIEAAFHSIYWTGRVATLRLWRRLALRRRDSADAWVIPGCDV